jgi:hypothetical protein
LVLGRAGSRTLYCGRWFWSTCFLSSGVSSSAASLRHPMFIFNEELDPFRFEEFLKVVEASRPSSSSNS